jgi:hypothetical protein
VDELANTTSTPNGKEEMTRCEEIFRQVCWLEERFWPDVDGMGEEDGSAQLGPQVGMGRMDNGTFTGPMNQNMNGPISNNAMGGQMNGQMNGNSMNGQMNNTGMSGSLSNALSNTMNNGRMNSNDGTPGPDGGTSTFQMGQMAPNS